MDREGGPSVCDGRSPIFSGPPLFASISQNSEIFGKETDPPFVHPP